MVCFGAVRVSGMCGRMGRASAVRVVCVGGWGGLCEWCVWEDGEG